MDIHTHCTGCNAPMDTPRASRSTLDPKICTVCEGIYQDLDLLPHDVRCGCAECMGELAARR